MNKLIIVAAILLTTGCTPKNWINNNVTQQQAQQEFAECQYEVTKHTPTYDGTGDPIAAGIASGTRKNQIMEACMQMKGYHLESASR